MSAVRRTLIPAVLALGLVTPAEAAPAPCDVRAVSGQDVSALVATAHGGATVCLPAGRYPALRLAHVAKRPMVTVRAAPGVPRAAVTVRGVRLLAVAGLRVRGLLLTDRVSVVRSGSRLRFTGNEIRGRAEGGHATAGVYLYGWHGPRHGLVRDVHIEGNAIHGVDWPAGAPAGPGDGYGIVMAGRHRDVTIRGNTISHVAVDAIQSSGGDDLVIDRNTFLGPGHDASHPGVHADLFQLFGDAARVRFTRNVARDTGTDTSLLLQSGRLRDVVISGNDLRHDGTGAVAQIWPVHGLTLRGNVFTGSRWGRPAPRPGPRDVRHRPRLRRRRQPDRRGGRPGPAPRRGRRGLGRVPLRRASARARRSRAHPPGRAPAVLY